MARKHKGAALYELLYRDKSKPGEGALKLPSWFRTKNAPPPAQPGQAAAAPAAPDEAPPNPAGAAPQPSSAEQPTAPAPMAVTPIGPAAGTPARPPTLPGATGTSRPAAPAATGQPNRPGVFSPPPRWLEVENGRIHMELTSRAALLTACGAVCVLLLSFILGMQRGKAIQRGLTPAAQGGDTTLADASKKPPDANIVPRPLEQDTHVGTTTAKPPSNNTEAAADPYEMKPGKSYVIVNGSFKDQAAAESLAALLKERNYDDIIVRRQMVLPKTDPPVFLYLVRTWKERERAAASKLADELGTVMEDLVRQHPSLGINITSDPRSRPRVVTGKANP